MDERIAKFNKMKINELKELLVKFKTDISYNVDLKKKIGLISGVKQKFFLKLMN